MAKKEQNEDFNFEIKKEIEVLSESSNGWRKELNLVSFNGKEAKLDIRSWNSDHTRMGKGISLDYEEAQLLAQAIEGLEDDF